MMERLLLTSVFVLGLTVVVEPQVRLRFLPAAGGGAALTCPAPCRFNTSFTSAQGWTSPPYTQIGTGCGSGYGAQQSGWNNWGSWTLAPDCDQITTSANYASGRGGGGYRHWQGDGFDVDGGAANISWTNSSELWIRYFMRYQAGTSFTGDAPNFEKDLYMQGTCQWTFGYNGGGIGFRTYNDARQNVASNVSWLTWVGASSGGVADGNWDEFQVHVKMDTNGANGVGEIWFNGSLIMSVSDINWGTCSGWTETLIGENQSDVDTGPNTYRDYDDIAISASGYITGVN